MQIIMQNHSVLQLETINKFLEGCKSYGMSSKDLFVPLDLHELCNKSMVGETIGRSSGDCSSE